MILQRWVVRQDAGDAKMSGIAANIADGAMSFLRAEYRVLAVYVLVAGLLLGWQSTLVSTSHPLIVVSFIIGAVFSIAAGYIGMRIATKANVRTTQAARTSLAHALKVSFNGGSVMGLGIGIGICWFVEAIVWDRATLFGGVVEGKCGIAGGVARIICVLLCHIFLGWIAILLKIQFLTIKRISIMSFLLYLIPCFGVGGLS